MKRPLSREEHLVRVGVISFVVFFGAWIAAVNLSHDPTGTPTLITAAVASAISFFWQLGYIPEDAR